jgi:N-hydroxyarylamine O-acetyltransferase
MKVDAYLARIGYTGPRDVNAGTLRAIHRAHLIAIPYENLDIHLGRTLELDITRIYDKLVTQGRGGWCYEMNGLLSWALSALGFQVTQMTSAVGTFDTVTDIEDDHMILRVDLDVPWLADVGFGNGLVEPTPLREGPIQQMFHVYALDRQGDRWMFTNQPHSGDAYVFDERAYTLQGYAGRCTWLQTDPASSFVRNTKCFRYEPGGEIHRLSGLVYSYTSVAGRNKRVIDEHAAYARALRETFRLTLSDAEIDTLWQGAQTRHAAWAGSQSV